jgi:hypothetical protein
MADPRRERATGGPAATAEWVRPARPGNRPPLHALPDITNTTPGIRPVFHVLSAPYIASGPTGGGPLFSLTLLLARQPQPGEDSILPLITGGVCALTLSITPPPDDLAALAAGGGGAYRAIFPRRLRYALRSGDPPTPLAEVSEEGASGRGALTCTLDRASALATLAVLRGDEGGLVVECAIGFRAIGAELPPLRVTVDLARTHAALAGYGGTDRRIAEGDLGDCLATLVDSGTIRVAGAPDVSGAELSRVLLPDLLRALLPILNRVGDGDAGIQEHFRLGAQPPAGSTASFARTAGPAVVERALLVTRPLRDILRDVLDEHGVEPFVHLVVAADNGDIRPIARRLPASRGGAGGGRAVSALASLGPIAAALPAVLRTNSAARLDAHTLAVSDLVLHSTAVRPQHAWALDDLIIDGFVAGQNRLRYLPVIEGDTALWPDRVDSARSWYAPELVLVQPDPAIPDASPFRFSFQAVGHDAQGRPGLEATIRLTLRGQLSAAARAAWQAQDGKPPPVPVLLNGLSASLAIPFRDERGEARAEAITATSIETVGDDTIATFRLTDQWARLCYGALAIPGFQRQPVRLAASYTFAAYVPVREQDSRIDWGGKYAIAAPLTIPSPGNGRDGTHLAAPFRSYATTVVPAALAVHPHLIAPLDIIPAQQKTYGIRSQGRTSQLDIAIPCAEFGALYVQATESGETAIGCRDAFTLGQAQLQLYEQIEVELGTPRPGLRVYRSLQVPGRFLVVPEAYTIARFEPGDSRAYRPAIYLFSNVDAVQPARSSCILLATLQPAVPPFRRWQLLAALRQRYHPTPTLEWPTELAVTPKYGWAIADSGDGAGRITPAAAKVPDGFQVSLTTGLDGVMQLKAIIERAGVNASVTFPLNDGTSLSSTLVIDLARIDGPWAMGPVEVARAGGGVTLRNRIEQPVDISDLLLDSTDAPAGTFAVERRLAADESTTLEGVPPAGSVLPCYALAGGAGALDEIRTFIEDIYTNVIFLGSLDFAALRLAYVTIEARIIGVAGSATGTLTAADAVAEVKFVLPLTVYLAQPTLQFRLVPTTLDGTVATGPWRDWRLDTLGNVVAVATDLLQEA